MCIGSWDSVVSIENRYGLEGPGFCARWGTRLFRTCPYRPRHPHILLYNGYWVYFTGVKQLRHGVDHLSLAPRLCLGRAVTLPLVWSLTGCHRVTVTCICVCVCVCIYICLCVCVCVCRGILHTLHTLL